MPQPQRVALSQVKSDVAAYASDPTGGCMSRLHVAVRTLETAHGACHPGSASLQLGLAELTRHVFGVFVAASLELPSPWGAERGDSLVELLGLLPTIAQSAIADAGTSYDGSVAVALLGEATSQRNRAIYPGALLPVLGVFAGLPDTLSDQQSSNFSAVVRGCFGDVSADDFPSIAKVLTLLVAKQPLSFLWSSTLRNFLQYAAASSSAGSFSAVRSVLFLVRLPCWRQVRQH
jgi:hypothetical protein